MLTANKLRELFVYDQDTGQFFRRKPIRGSAAGSVAGALRPTGYVQVCIDYKRYYAHRLAWLYMTGEWPNGEIDHINRNRADNRFGNLREASRAQNCVNAVRRSLSGHPNVYWSEQRKKWLVRFKPGTEVRTKEFGAHVDLADAIANARSVSEMLYGKFSPHLARD